MIKHMENYLQINLHNKTKNARAIIITSIIVQRTKML